MEKSEAKVTAQMKQTEQKVKMFGMKHENSTKVIKEITEEKNDFWSKCQKLSENLLVSKTSEEKYVKDIAELKDKIENLNKNVKKVTSQKAKSDKLLAEERQRAKQLAEEILSL